MTPALLLGLALQLLTAAQQPNVPQSIRDASVLVAQHAIQYEQSTSMVDTASTTTPKTTPSLVTEVQPTMPIEPAFGAANEPIDAIVVINRDLSLKKDDTREVTILVTGDFDWSKASVWGPDGVLRVGTGWDRSSQHGKFMYDLGTNKVAGEYIYEISVKKSEKSTDDGITKVIKGTYTYENREE